MSDKLAITIENQPDLTSCGPTCLHAIYQFLGDKIPLSKVISEIKQHDDGGGTFAVTLGQHALEAGYSARIISFNINIFDPSWFHLSMDEIKEFLKERLFSRRGSKKEKTVLLEYIAFLDAGGVVEFMDLTKNLIESLIREGYPILTGLSSTWLYQTPRENPSTNVDDPIAGDPSGHFVILYGIDDDSKIEVADPYSKNPIAGSHYYHVNIDRLINSILLGDSSYDGNLLLIEKRKT